MGWNPLEFVADITGGILGYKGAEHQATTQKDIAREQMWFNEEQSAIQRDWQAKESATAREFQRDMSNTAVQRRMADLKKAGINPILAGKFDASTPAGAMGTGSAASYSGIPNIPNKMASAVQVARTIGDLRLLKSQIKKTDAEAEKTGHQADIFDVTAKFFETMDNAIGALAGKDKDNNDWPGVPWRIKESLSDLKRYAPQPTKPRSEKQKQRDMNSALDKYPTLPGVDNKKRKSFDF